MKFRGVAYYPEAWPRERWDEDIALMRAAGINLVRMGEFAWARFEPGEDRFDLGWWTDICDRMRRAEIQVLACTPSAAPPAWLTSRHPEVLAVAADGSRPPHGLRRHYCPNAPHYRERVAKVNRRIADAVRGNPAVIAWQIDNEIAPEPFLCHCEVCAAGFREWLRARYGTLAALNDAWGNAFWSGDFSDWEQIRPPRYRPSWRLDYQRFQDVSFRDFIQGQAATLRAVRADWTVLANLWVGLNPIADAALLNEGLDVAAYDGYWDCYASREHYSAILGTSIATSRRCVAPSGWPRRGRGTPAAPWPTAAARCVPGPSRLSPKGPRRTSSSAGGSPAWARRSIPRSSIGAAARDGPTTRCGRCFTSSATWSRGCAACRCRSPTSRSSTTTTPPRCCTSPRGPTAARRTTTTSPRPPPPSAGCRWSPTSCRRGRGSRSPPTAWWCCLRSKWPTPGWRRRSPRSLQVGEWCWRRRGWRRATATASSSPTRCPSA